MLVSGRSKGPNKPNLPLVTLDKVDTTTHSSLLSFLVVLKDKGAVPGLKRTLSEGNGDNEKDGADAKSDTKRPKMQNEELEAKLELKITAKAGAHPKLEKVRPPEHLHSLPKIVNIIHSFDPIFSLRSSKNWSMNI